MESLAIDSALDKLMQKSSHTYEFYCGYCDDFTTWAAKPSGVASQCQKCYLLLTNSLDQCSLCFDQRFLCVNKDNQCIQCLTKKRQLPVLSTFNDICFFCRQSSKFEEFERSIQCTNCKSRIYKKEGSCFGCQVKEDNIPIRNDIPRCKTCWMTVRNQRCGYTSIDLTKQVVSQYCPFCRGTKDWKINNVIIRQCQGCNIIASNSKEECKCRNFDYKFVKEGYSKCYPCWVGFEQQEN